MAITTRQSNLLVHADWTKIYQTFRNADFQSYDYETLRKSMIDYLRTYYAEDFNDFTESSEYIALIDLIAFLGQSLAFRGDLNARENFIDTAERRDSVLKLARLISYNPKRNIAASGYLKVTGVSSTEAITDSNGINLANLQISWNDSSNDNWLEQFTSIVNATLVNTQVVGKPGASKSLNNITTDEYGISIAPGIVPVYKFSAKVEDSLMPFEVVSATSATQSYVYEKDPVANGIFNMLYKNDNQGNGSINTGFFLYFKQGALSTLDFSVNEKLPNRVVNINYDDINGSDLWLYSTNASGAPDIKWKSVPAIGGINVVYNLESDRNLYQVNTRVNDQVDLVFGDGAFANVPQGNYRLYYRQSNGLSYKITPSEMQLVNITMNYVSRTNRIETLTITANLNYTVANSAAKETIDDIRTKAPQQYYTQNRMVTGEDYNILPYTTFSNVLKVKTVNRSSSGVSRYLDVIDVSGKYSSTNIFGEDGALYRDITLTNSTFSFSNSSEVYNTIYSMIIPMIASKSVMHLYYYSTVPKVTASAANWNQTLLTSGTTNGFFTDGTGDLQTIGTGASGNFNFIQAGALLKFVPPIGSYFTKDNVIQAGSASLVSDKTVIYAAVNSNTLTSALISQPVPTGAICESIIPVLHNDWTTAFISDVAAKILAKKNFGIRYDSSSMAWIIVQPANLNLLAFDISSAGSSADSSWVLSFTYFNGQYTVAQRNLLYFIESESETRFYFDPKVKVYDSNIGTTIRDSIKLLKINSQPDSSAAIGSDQSWYVYDCVTQIDGYRDNQRILVTFPDSDSNGIPDDPTLFDSFVAPLVNTSSKKIFFKQNIDYDNFAKYSLMNTDSVVSAHATLGLIQSNRGLYLDGQVFYAYSEDAFYVLTTTAVVPSSLYIARTGRKGIYFQYRHNAPGSHRIDPSPNNIMDMYFLTKEYNTAYSAWIRDTSGKVVQPVAPTSEMLRTEFAALENLKAMSDSIIYSPATFKPIFGNKAVSALRATFKVVKNPNVSISDNDIKSRVISTINKYFEISNWDFGETFYFSELSAYLHSTLVPNISSIIIVPGDAAVAFGGLFQINAEANEIVVSAATVDNVEIISAITAAHINQSIQ